MNELVQIAMPSSFHYTNVLYKHYYSIWKSTVHFTH